MTLMAFCSSDFKTHHLNPSSWGVEKEHGNRGVVDLHLPGLCGLVLGNAPGEMLVVCSVGARRRLRVLCWWRMPG